MATLLGKRVWLIGASEGIGRELALQLAKQGAVLALSARNLTRLEEVREACKSNVVHAPILAPCDVADSSSVRSAWEVVAASWGAPDILIYNAGTYEPMPAQQYHLQKIEAMVDVNFRGALRVLDCALPVLIAKEAGHIVLVGSVAGYRGLPDAMGYGASKAALIHLAENLMCDLKPYGIRTQIVNPGFVKTRLTDKNSFSMPGIITAEQAAGYIVRGLQASRFEIAFPFVFFTIMKLLRLLPSALYFRLIGAKRKTSDR